MKKLIPSLTIALLLPLPRLYAPTQLMAPSDSDIFFANLMKFNHSFNRFFRDYLGCPEYAHDVKECDTKRGFTNNEAFQKAAQEAPKVFGKSRFK